ncbi:MAG: glycosyltransferase family 4 protein [Anaerolineales bacterium]|jgi:glycosyltransferase involved in cell wall biosynthesis
MPERIVICRSNPIAPDPRAEKVACTLAEAGYAVTLMGWDRTGQLATSEQRNRMRYRRLPIRAEFARGIHNLPALLRWQFGLLGWLLKHRDEYDLIHACDFDTVLPALVCKKAWGKKVVYDIFDFYSDHLRATPAWIKSAIRYLDLRVINQADAVILVDEARKQQIAGSHPKYLEVIYNSPQDVLRDLQAMNQPHPRSEMHLVYVGLLQVERGLMELLEVLRLRPEWTLDLAGFGGDEDKILELARLLPNVTFHGRISYKHALELSNLADVLLATYDPTIPNHRYSSPNKVFEAMMLAKPIIVARDTNMDRIVSAAGSGLVVPYGDISALEMALARLANDSHLRLSLGKNARKAYEMIYSWSRMQTKILQLYAVVLD